LILVNAQGAEKGSFEMSPQIMEVVMAAYADPRERLVSDVKTLVADMEEFLSAVGTESKDKIAGIRPRLEAAMQRARTQAAGVEASIEGRVREGARRANDYATEHPWQTAGMAAAVGAAVGAIVAVLLSRN
jgi:ElaB/YqjD/DUF883 family membrane-anchored ribosome-binding protein